MDALFALQLADRELDKQANAQQDAGAKQKLQSRAVQLLERKKVVTQYLDSGCDKQQEPSNQFLSPFAVSRNAACVGFEDILADLQTVDSKDDKPLYDRALQQYQDRLNQRGDPPMMLLNIVPLFIGDAMPACPMFLRVSSAVCSPDRQFLTCF